MEATLHALLKQLLPVQGSDTTMLNSSKEAKAKNPKIY